MYEANLQIFVIKKIESFLRTSFVFACSKYAPEIGKAVLFYDQLPDGNMDDFSQHAAEPVRKGEKWLINLWTWNPRFR